MALDFALLREARRLLSAHASPMRGCSCLPAAPQPFTPLCWTQVFALLHKAHGALLAHLAAKLGRAPAAAAAAGASGAAGALGVQGGGCAFQVSSHP